MKTEQYQAAATLILIAAEAAALKAAGPEDCPVAVGPVTFTLSPESGGNKFDGIAVHWTVGPAWGKIKLKFLSMHYARPGELMGVWSRGDGVAMMPAGFPMLPALKSALAKISAAAVAAADQNLPNGIVKPATL